MEAQASELVGAAADRRASAREHRDSARHRVEVRERPPPGPSRRARGPALSSVAICTDSSALLSGASATSLGVDVVSITVTLDGEPFDEQSSSLDGFYDRLRGGAVATTSQPTPSDLAEAYERAAARGAQSVASIHLDGRVSGTTSSAELAARGARIPVTVVDTGTVSYGVGICVRTAAQVVAAGGSVEDAAERAMRLGATLRNVFVARPGRAGRVPATDKWTLLSFSDGAAAPVAECASVAQSLEAMTRETLRGMRLPISVAVGHAGRELEAAADELAHRLLRTDGVLTVERYRVGAAVGAHTGPESFGLFWWPTS